MNQHIIFWHSCCTLHSRYLSSSLPSSLIFLLFFLFSSLLFSSLLFSSLLFSSLLFSYHIISYHIISYHIVSCHVLFHPIPSFHWLINLQRRKTQDAGRRTPRMPRRRRTSTWCTQDARRRTPRTSSQPSIHLLPSPNNKHHLVYAVPPLHATQHLVIHRARSRRKTTHHAALARRDAQQTQHAQQKQDYSPCSKPSISLPSLPTLLSFPPHTTHLPPQSCAAHLDLCAAQVLRNATPRTQTLRSM